MALLYRVGHDVRSYLGKYPGIILPLQEMRRARKGKSHWLTPQVYQPDTEIVIEGSPRSGNTFSIAAFYVSCDGQLPKVAHHIHVPAQLMKAVRDDRPAVALLRKPIDAMASVLVRNTRKGPKQALRGYINFYEPLLAYKDDIVIAPFETVTGDFGKVLDDVNKRYGTSYAGFDHSEETVKKCFSLIEEKNRLHTGQITEKAVARPSADRKKLNEEAKAKLRDPSYARMMRRADELYDTLRSA